MLQIGTDAKTDLRFHRRYQDAVGDRGNRPIRIQQPGDFAGIVPDIERATQGRLVLEVEQVAEAHANVFAREAPHEAPEQAPFGLDRQSSDGRRRRVRSSIGDASPR
jgi:hypothetical protein